MGEGTRARWSSAMFKYNVLVIPVYWYLYVWPRPTTGTVNATDMLIPAGTKNGVSKQWEHLVIEQLERGQWQLRLGTGILAIIVLAMVVWIVADGVTVDRCCALVFVVGLLLAFLFGGRAMRAAIRDIRIKKQEQHDTSSAQLRRQSE